MCLLCQEANSKSRLRLDNDYVILVFDGFDFMQFPKKLFEGRNLRDYESIVQEFLQGPNEWKDYNGR